MVLQIDDESYNVYVMPTVLAKFQILGKAKPIEKKLSLQMDPTKLSF